jgi:plastocyanin
MKPTKKSLTWLACTAGSLAVASLAHAGSVVGTVKYAGTAAAPKKVQVTKDQHVCAKDGKIDESLLVGANKGLQNAVVSVEGVAGAKPPTEKATLDQKGCRFNPHISVVGVGAPLEILNNDGILHNLHTFSTVNRAFNKAQPKFKKVMKETFEKPEIFRIACDAHNWMEGWIVVTESPYYAVSSEDGSFTIKDVPAGTYTVKFWHEKLGEKTQQVTVAATGDARVEIEYAAQ